MTYCIYLADLAANALIQLFQAGCEDRFLSFERIEAYGVAVVEVLESRNEGATLYLSRDYTDIFFRDCSDYFVRETRNGKKGVRLRDGVEAEDLIRRFRGYLSLDVALAFMDRRAVAALGAPVAVHA